MDATTLLLRAAGEGAALRAAASAAAEGVFDRLPAPRAAVLLTRDAPARHAAAAAAALAAEGRCPVLAADRLPRFVGALDLVVGLGEDPGDPVLAEALAEAARRGAATALADPGAGPVRAAAGPDCAVAPRPAGAPGGGLLGPLGVALAALTAAGAVDLAPAAVLAEVADAADAEAAACAPDRGEPVNPARVLGSRLRGRRIVLAGDGPEWAAVAGFGAARLLEAGVAAHATAVTDLLRAWPALAPAEADLFHDPRIDGPAAGGPVLPLEAIVVTSPEGLGAMRARVGRLPGVRVECPAADVEARHRLSGLCVTAVRLAAAAAYVMEED